MLDGQEIRIFEEIDSLLWEGGAFMQCTDADLPMNISEEFLPEIYSLKANGSNIENIAKALYKIQGKLSKHGAQMPYCRDLAQKILDI